jgi:hypothetical protein
LAPFKDLLIERGNKGKVRLRFGTIVWNIGLGPMEVRGSGRQNRKMMVLKQVIQRSDGGTRTVTPTGVTSFYATDNHDHWHISRFIVASLYPVPADGTLPAASAVRTMRKIGFCLTDLVRVPEELRPASSAPRRVYPYWGCGNSKSVKFKMGIAVGWGDEYKQWFTHQSVDITGLDRGNYRLCATPNPAGSWLEINPTNNSYWMDLHIDIGRNELTILAQGETACQPESTLALVGAQALPVSDRPGFQCAIFGGLTK